MRRINLVKVFKIAIGCCLAMFIADSLGLRSSTAVCTITLLSIQNTKKDTFKVAGKRFCSFFVALAVAILSFCIFGYTIASLGVYLFVFVLMCQWLELMDGVSMSTVLMLRIWVLQSITLHCILNELILMMIGIVMGIVMNTYMPRQIDKIKLDQRSIETGMSTILNELSKAILKGQSNPSIGDSLDQLYRLLGVASKRAYEHMKNTLTKDMHYYVQYIDLRKNQCEIMQRINDNISRLTYVPYQSYVVSNFIKVVASSVHEHNNADELINQLVSMKTHFKSKSLPTTRVEFETRAVLFEIVNELHRLLLAKKEFAESLTQQQIQTFWKNDN